MYHVTEVVKSKTKKLEYSTIKAVYAYLMSL